MVPPPPPPVTVNPDLLNSGQRTIGAGDLTPSGTGGRWASTLSVSAGTAVVRNGGADYGPDTVGTTTVGLQEALNACATLGGSVRVQNDGEYDLTNTAGVVWPNHNNVDMIADDGVVIAFGPGVTPAANTGILNMTTQIRGCYIRGMTLNMQKGVTVSFGFFCAAPSETGLPNIMEDVEVMASGSTNSCFYNFGFEDMNYYHCVASGTTTKGCSWNVQIPSGSFVMMEPKAFGKQVVINCVECFIVSGALTAVQFAGTGNNRYWISTTEISDGSNSFVAGNTGVTGQGAGVIALTANAPCMTVTGGGGGISDSAKFITGNQVNTTIIAVSINNTFGSVGQGAQHYHFRKSVFSFRAVAAGNAPNPPGFAIQMASTSASGVVVWDGSEITHNTAYGTGAVQDFSANSSTTMYINLGWSMSGSGLANVTFDTDCNWQGGGLSPSLAQGGTPLIDGTVYHNVSGRPILIYFQATFNSNGGAATLTIALGPSSSPSAVSAITFPVGGINGIVQTIALRIPSSRYFSFTKSGAGTITAAAARVELA